MGELSMFTVEMKTKKDENIAETHGKPRENIAMKVK
jgi:hypothetical protein